MKLEKIQTIFQKIIQIVLSIISIIILLIGIASIFINGYFETTFYHPAEKTFFEFSPGIIEIITISITLLIIGLITRKVIKKIPNKLLLILLVLGSTILYFYWINAIKIMPSNDQKVIYEMVIAFLNNDIGKYLQTDQYLFLYPYQLGITLIISIFFKLFGTNYLIFEYVNAISSVINVILLYFISKKIFKDKINLKTLIILLGGFTLYFMFFNVHFYGNIIGLTFSLLSILLILLCFEKNNFIFAIFSALFIKLAIIAKSNYEIFLIGILIYIALQLLKNLNKKNIIKIITFIISFIIFSISYNILTTNILKIENSNDGVPMISFIYMGMAPETDKTPGWYTGDPVEIYRKNNYDTENSVKETKELIKDRLSYFMNFPNKFLDYYVQKISSTWLNPTFQTVWCSLPGQRYNYDQEYAHYLSYHETSLSMVDGKLYEYEKIYFNIYQIIIFVFAGIGIIRLLKNKDINLILIPIIFIGGFLFHLIWETKSIYVIQYYFLLIPYSAYGIDEMLNMLIKNSKIILKRNI